MWLSPQPGPPLLQLMYTLCDSVLKIATESSKTAKQSSFLLLWSRLVDLQPSSTEFLQKRKKFGFRSSWFSECWPLGHIFYSFPPASKQHPSPHPGPLPSVICTQCAITNSKSPFGAQNRKTKLVFVSLKSPSWSASIVDRIFAKAKKSSDFGPIDFQNVGL